MELFRLFIFVCSILFLLSSVSVPAHADCVNPPGKEAQQVYNSTHKTMQFCDGTNWWDMKAANGGGGGGGNSFDECQPGETVVFSSTNNRFECPFDHTPDAFSFSDETGVELSTVTESDILQITSIDDDTDISISGDGSPEYRICADGTCSGAPAYTSAAGTIDNGDYLQLRLTSAGAGGVTWSATVYVGEGSDQWDVTTPVNCSLPWGGTIAHGDNITAYLNSSEPCGGSCASETRTCIDGVLSGSYTNSSCSVSTCASCDATSFGSNRTLCYVPNLSHGASGGACQFDGGCSYTCNNGSLSGNNGCN